MLNSKDEIYWQSKFTSIYDDPNNKAGFPIITYYGDRDILRVAAY